MLDPPDINCLSAASPAELYLFKESCCIVFQRSSRGYAANCTSAWQQIACDASCTLFAHACEVWGCLVLCDSVINNFCLMQVLLEFKEYATEVDVDFVRRSVRAIGRCAISLERAAERCINVLLELIQTKVNYVVQEAIIVIKDIFRRYPNRSG